MPKLASASMMYPHILQDVFAAEFPGKTHNFIQENRSRRKVPMTPNKRHYPRVMHDLPIVNQDVPSQGSPKVGSSVRHMMSTEVPTSMRAEF